MEATFLAVPDLHNTPLSAAKDFRGFRFFKNHSWYDLKEWRQQKIETTHLIHIRRNPLDVCGIHSTSLYHI